MSNKIPRVSFIVPVFNVEEWLFECLDSIQKQKSENWEAVIVDDCSTDGSIFIINEFLKKDSRFSLIKHKVNKGLGESRNTGVHAAIGEFLFFLDSDDILPNESIKNMLKIADSNNVDLVVGDYIEFSDGDEIKDEQVNNFKADNILLNLPNRFTWKDISDNYALLWTSIYLTTAWGKLFRRSRWLECSCQVPGGLRMAEDFIPVKKFIFSNNSISIYKECALIYRKRKGSATTKRSLKAFEIINAYKFAFDEFEKCGIFPGLKNDFEIFFIRNLRDHMLNLLNFRYWVKFYIAAAPVLIQMEYTHKIGYLDFINIKAWSQLRFKSFAQLIRYYLFYRVR